MLDRHTYTKNRYIHPELNSTTYYWNYRNINKCESEQKLFSIWWNYFDDEILKTPYQNHITTIWCMYMIYSFYCISFPVLVLRHKIYRIIQSNVRRTEHTQAYSLQSYRFNTFSYANSIYEFYLTYGLQKKCITILESSIRWIAVAYGYCKHCLWCMWSAYLRRVC